MLLARLFSGHPSSDLQEDNPPTGYFPFYCSQKKASSQSNSFLRKKNVIKGWGTWIRTKIARSRAESSTVKLSPISAFFIMNQSSLLVKMKREPLLKD